MKTLTTSAVAIMLTTASLVGQCLPPPADPGSTQWYPDWVGQIALWLWNAW